MEEGVRIFPVERGKETLIELISRLELRIQLMRLTLIHEIDAGLIESAAEQLNDVEAVKNDLGVRETVVNDREVRGIHIHTHGFNGFAGFPGIAHEIADESGHSAIRKDIENLTGFCVKKEKRH